MIFPHLHFAARALCTGCVIFYATARGFRFENKPYRCAFDESVDLLPSPVLRRWHGTHLPGYGIKN